MNTVQKLFLFHILFNILKSNNQSLEACHCVKDYSYPKFITAYHKKSEQQIF